MRFLRDLVLKYRLVAALVIACALLARVVIPTGWMLMDSAGGVVLAPCSGTGPMLATQSDAPTHHAMMAMDHAPQQPADTSGGGEGKAEQPCAYSALSAPPLAGADPFLLGLAILFVLAIALRPTRAPPATGSPRRLRPPLRGPPATA